MDGTVKLLRGILHNFAIPFSAEKCNFASVSKYDMPDIADILENDILRASPELLATLLKDHTTSRGDAACNIFLATSDYEHLGTGYGYNDPLSVLYK